MKLPCGEDQEHFIAFGDTSVGAGEQRMLVDGDLRWGLPLLSLFLAHPSALWISFFIYMKKISIL